MRTQEQQKEYWALYYEKHKETYKARSKTWRALNKRQHAHNALMSKYGIAIGEYESLLAAQNGLCAICKKPETRQRNGTVYRLHVDHDHNTGAVRSLLCHHCNAGLGHFMEDPAIMRVALLYIEGIQRQPGIKEW